MPKFRFDQYLALLLFGGVILLQPSLKLAQWVNVPKVAAEAPIQVPKLISPITIPVAAGLDPLGTSLATMSASAVYVMDRNSAAILYQKNANELRYPASTAKMMTALVARQDYPLFQVMTVTDAAYTTGTVAGLKLGEQITVENLLKALLIPSGNDAALVLGQNHPFGYAGFVNQMNQMANQLHLTKTTFNNVSGLDTDNELSSARDLAILANQLVKDPVLAGIVATPQTTIQDLSGRITHKLKSTQELYGQVQGVVGIKTGTTQNAGENLITEIDRDGHRVIFVVLGSTNRFADSKVLINWVFANYNWKTYSKN